MMRIVLVLIALLLLAAVPLPAARCDQDTYVIQGTVTDGGGNPVADARVYVLVDKISKKEFGKHGVRARSFLADGRGDYVASVTCGGQPNPCAGKPKHLTLAAEKRGFGTRLQVFKLKELEGFEDAGRCVIEAPDIRLPPGY